LIFTFSSWDYFSPFYLCSFSPLPRQQKERRNDEVKGKPQGRGKDGGETISAAENQKIQIQTFLHKSNYLAFGKEILKLQLKNSHQVNQNIL